MDGAGSGVNGAGPILGRGPGPPIVPLSGLEGTCAGPGPGGKMGPRPNHTKNEAGSGE